MDATYSLWTNVEALQVALVGLFLLFVFALCFFAMVLLDKPQDVDGAALITAERERHYEEEGFTVARDTQYVHDELALAAMCYVTPDRWRDMVTMPGGAQLPSLWPWNGNWWKPRSRKEDLIRAGALIAAEIDRLLLAERRQAQRLLEQAEAFAESEAAGS